MTQQIWTGLLDSERLTRYYSRLADKYTFRQRLLLAVIVLSGLSTDVVIIVNSLQGTPMGIALLVLSGIATLAGVVNFWLQDSVKANSARLISNQYATLYNDWKRLWYQEKPDEELVAVLTERLVSIGAALDCPDDHDLNKQAESEADRVVGGEFSPAA